MAFPFDLRCESDTYHLSNYTPLSTHKHTEWMLLTHHMHIDYIQIVKTPAHIYTHTMLCMSYMHTPVVDWVMIFHQDLQGHICSSTRQLNFLMMSQYLCSDQSRMYITLVACRVTDMSCKANYYCGMLDYIYHASRHIYIYIYMYIHGNTHTHTYRHPNRKNSKKPRACLV